MNQREKGEGFPGQRIVVLPRPVLVQAREHPLLKGVLPTDIGYFPRARGHWRERPRGAEQGIFIYCTHGNGWCELAGTRHKVGRGEVLVIPPGTPHCYGADDARPWTIHWLHAQGDLLGRFLQELDVSLEQPVLRSAAGTQFFGLLQEVLDILEHGYATSQLIEAAQATAHLLAVLIREQRRVSFSAPAPAQRIQRTIAYMREHLGQPLQLDFLAALAGLSRSRYVALFKEQAGYAPIDYLIRLRMHRACQLLDTTESGVKEIAAELGYEDSLYFSRVFRAVNELSPTEYRKVRKG